jgi:hypothetical protein
VVEDSVQQRRRLVEIVAKALSGFEVSEATGFSTRHTSSACQSSSSRPPMIEASRAG